DKPQHPFEPYDAPTATSEMLFTELTQGSWERRYAAHVEILRRGGDLLDEATRQRSHILLGDPALNHLPWLAGASGSRGAANDLLRQTRDAHAPARMQAVRILAEFSRLKAPASVFAEALRDDDLRVRLEALAALFDPSRELPLADVVKVAQTTDTYLLQTA